MENWAFTPELLSVYAKHWKTGEPSRRSLSASSTRAASSTRIRHRRVPGGFHPGHRLAYPPDPRGSTSESSRATPWPHRAHPGDRARYRSTYFSHIFSGGYSAGYYVYIWPRSSMPMLSKPSGEGPLRSGDGDVVPQERSRTVRDRGAHGQYVRFRGREPRSSAPEEPGAGSGVGLISRFKEFPVRVRIPGFGGHPSTRAGQDRSRHHPAPSLLA